MGRRSNVSLYTRYNRQRTGAISPATRTTVRTVSRSSTPRSPSWYAAQCGPLSSISALMPYSASAARMLAGVPLIRCHGMDCRTISASASGVFAVSRKSMWNCHASSSSSASESGARPPRASVRRRMTGERRSGSESSRAQSSTSGMARVTIWSGTFTAVAAALTVASARIESGRRSGSGTS